MGERERATFGAGCFWCVEAVFRELQGVEKIASGYTGGTVPNPTYEQVCTGRTGHAEAIQITFDPAVISYEELLEVFWKIHDPTQLNRQGHDIGTQYRTAIFYHNEKQKKAAEKSLKGQQKKYDKKITTEIKPAGKFYAAEDYHQQYLEKKGLSTCHI